ncbi:helix-turn-helix domain-containing protein [Rhodococcus sp. 2G]|uniref:helix-turn-helix domain-containing protein n=1 Tax=Rhodococcus sp. 2G TaxID=1570939 RepID=UPI0012EC7D75|nr:helix-turn-helix domain-containing protein [Rhodococcus sp. 2G]
MALPLHSTFYVIACGACQLGQVVSMSYQAVKWALTQVPPGLVSVPARAVLAVFAERADDHGKAAYPSLGTVAWNLGCSERNVADHVKALVTSGLLVKSPDQSPADKIPEEYRPVVYDLPLHRVRTDEKPARQKRGRKPKPELDPKDSSAAELDMKDSAISPEESLQLDPKDSSFRPEADFIQTVPEPPAEPPSEPPTTSARSHDVVEVCDRFDEFWSTYPLKKSKGDARKAWRKAVEKVGAQTVIDGALRFAQDPNLPRGENKGFIPYPATWLNGERWEDDPLPPRPSSTASSGRKSMTEDLHQLQAGANRVIAAEMRGATHTPQLALTGAYDANERPF